MMTNYEEMVKKYAVVATEIQDMLDMFTYMQKNIEAYRRLYELVSERDYDIIAEWDKMEEVRREVFENTKSYKEGKKQDLVKYYHEYKLAKTQEERDAISSVIQLSFADVDSYGYPYELREFLRETRGF